jgi:paraquat-inducible protein B
MGRIMTPSNPDDLRTGSSSGDPAPAAGDSYPTAGERIVDRGALAWLDHWGLRETRMWWVTAACAVVALVLAATAWHTSGPRVAIEFVEGYGLRPGDAVRLRGIDIGTVEHVVLNPALDRVEVTVQLMQEADAIAREGSQFWIERPQVTLSAVRGLETVVGPKYIAVQPGPSEGPKCQRFVGVESPRQIIDSGKHSLTLHFRQGHGLRAGSPVRFRGVQVGEVVDMALAPSATEILVRVDLIQGASQLARTGSLFWIERPQVGLAAVSGLDTVVGGPYLAVNSGSLDGPLVSQLTGLEAPPTETDGVGGLEVTLESDSRNSLQAGSPVIYRGVPIGRVTHVGLASDAASVETRLYIESEYLDLVRDNSKFWPISGVDVRLGFTGIRLGAESLATITAGGVAMATPDEPGGRVAAGYRFPLEAEANSSWLKWKPHLPVGTRIRPDLQPLSVKLRGTFSWPTKRWGLTRTQQQRTWVHVLPDQKLLCALNLGEIESLPDETIFEIEGQSIPLTKQNLKQRGSLAVISGVKLPNPPAAWKAQELRPPQAPEDCVVVSGTDSVPVAASRLQPGKLWLVDVSVPLTPDWHGAGVISRADGALIGLLIWRDGTALIAPYSPQP